jgi:hypothetical protein
MALATTYCPSWVMATCTRVIPSSTANSFVVPSNSTSGFPKLIINYFSLDLEWYDDTFGRVGEFDIREIESLPFHSAKGLIYRLFYCPPNGLVSHIKIRIS